MNQPLYDFNAYLIGVAEWAMTDAGKKKLGDKAQGAEQMLACLTAFKDEIAKTGGSEEKLPVIKSVKITRVH